ncbi:HAMP domain-containing sensor histidine kinase [Hyphomicrobium sp.]|uniref:sensor histidine kinase n=1 Tax=Hyphomicrobium sp. TaxID=82 RepID=UPI0025B9535B|nr:HAMP domain-containing sensor histidine kinase [Hyphomicrobium sp.]MCC7252581.1 HAMP domain-containing histidine kinase [Hyphomicrobium sp.]
MLVRRGVAGCILASVAAFVLALTAIGGDDLDVVRAVAPYALLSLAAVAFLAGEALPAKLRACCRTAKRAADAGTARPPTTTDDLVGMLDDTLKLARPAPAVAQLEPVNVTELLKDLAARPDGARLKLDARPRDIQTLASRPALSRALEILVDNALANGTWASVSCDHGTSALVVHVDDDGPGVPRSARPDVFAWQYYMSTPPSMQIGCRVELVIARQIVRSHGGDILVGPSPLGGARFTARLPLMGAHETVLAQAS